MGTLQGPEMFIGLAGAVGTDLDLIAELLVELLKEYRYGSYVIQLSKILEEVNKSNWPDLDNSSEERRINSRMDRGDKLREAVNRGDALAILSLGLLSEFRIQKTGKADQLEPVPRQVYIFKSLKHPDEVKSLRKIFGRNFFLISVYNSREKRIKKLASKIATTHHQAKKEHYRAKAEELIQRDEAEETNRYGQNVRETFPLADFFLSEIDPVKVMNSLSRFLEILFNEDYKTPSKDEHSMAHAYLASLKSSSMARQVGAMISNENGDLLSVGTNEVPKKGGGHYWCGDENDGRDHVFGEDKSYSVRSSMIGDFIERLKKAKWFVGRIRDKEIRDLLLDSMEKGDPPILKGSQVMNIIEYGRSVHAEMDAITTAARLGINIKDAILYCTTFPCHECARHIVSSGIKKLVYIEPYPKSLVSELYQDSISLDDDKSLLQFSSFEGIAPRLYMRVFNSDGKRHKKMGKLVRWEKSEQIPNCIDFYYSPMLIKEQKEFNLIMKTLEQKKINWRKNHG